METSGKNQYPNSCYHPDSSLKLDFYISKIAKRDKQRKKTFTHSENPKSE